MPIQKTCTILHLEQVSASGYSLLLNAWPVSEKALPGQFVHVALDGLFLRRPLSICDADGPNLRLVFELRGVGTRQLAEKKEGDFLDLLGPLGHGFSLDGDKTLLVGGGVGAAPLLFAAKRFGGTADAILGFRSGSSAYLTEEFKAACRRLRITSEDGSLGEPGLVD
ncbi:MAG: dihydroorotate dehydrogenase electron transfer subunit, partial [Oscillospiraceae bacterium]|nr:dihydroorotate dehydrogenase electron transfer subunit [Oscillospiraceae bacterium]